MTLDKVKTGNAIVDPSTYVDIDRLHVILDQVRSEDPLMWLEPTDYRPFWLVSKFADIREVQRQPALFLNRPRSFLLTRKEEEGIFADTGEYVATRSVIQVDGDEHRLLRRVTQSWFLPNAVGSIEPAIRKIANELIDNLAEHPGRVDFAKVVALWYPLRVITKILGLPDDAATFMLGVTQQNFGANDPEIATEAGFAGIKAAQERIGEYFANVTADRRANPRSDVASVIANARINGELLTELEATSYYFTLATAGHDTTSSTVAGAMLALIQHPEQLALLQSNPSLIGSTAIDEFLRWTTPIKHFFRTAVEDYELRGKKIRAGESLMMCYPSGNRDEEVFAEPYAFRVDRTPNPQIAFGYGAHMCLGMHLAKLELKVFFEELIPRLQSVSLAGEPALTRANFVQSLKRLPIDIVVGPRRDLAPVTNG